MAARRRPSRRTISAVRLMLTMQAVPAGFSPLNLDFGFLKLIGPIYCRLDNGVEVLGLRVEERHCNSVAIAHGGVLAAFADVLVTRAVSITRQPPVPALTISLNTDYIGAAPLGAWLEGRAVVNKATGSITFAACEVRVGEAIVLQASGAMKMLPKRP
jgi:uncharacterized protein (TIGR00369 family)